jgi:hypothetical protein
MRVVHLNRPASLEPAYFSRLGLKRERSRPDQMGSSVLNRCEYEKVQFIRFYVVNSAAVWRLLLVNSKCAVAARVTTLHAVLLSRLSCTLCRPM